MINEFKKVAKKLRKEDPKYAGLTHSQVLHLVVKAAGYKSVNDYYSKHPKG